MTLLNFRFPSREEKDKKDNEKGAFVGVDFTVPSRDYPITHAAVDAPLCPDCKQLDLPFFDPSCPGCRDILKSPSTTIGKIFAIMRQWVPQTQQNIDILVTEMLRRGANVNDRDGLTDMTCLHYACKAGASGVGDFGTACKVVKLLLSQGADVHMRCRWTHMTALHYAAYFDVAPVLKVLLNSRKDVNVDEPCQEYDGGSPLHIAASNLCLDAAKILIEYGADLDCRDELNRIPIDCVPEAASFDLIPDVQEMIAKMRKLMSPDMEKSIVASRNSVDSITGRAVLKSMNIKIGDRVLVGGIKAGYLRYCGTTEFSTGIWAGIELDEPEGKNDGTVKGVKYFHCQPNHGLFAPINRVNKFGISTLLRQSSLRRSKRSSPPKVNVGRIDVSKISSKISSNLRSNSENLHVNDRVVVIGHGRRKGTIRYVGETQFAAGWWYGVELDNPEGKNDGSVHGVRYFDCKFGHGVFAPPTRVMKLSPHYENDKDMESSLESCRSLTDSQESHKSSTSSPFTSLKRSLSMRHRKLQMFRQELANESSSSTTSSFNRSYSVRYQSKDGCEAKKSGFEQPPWQSTTLTLERSTRRSRQLGLEIDIGINVLLNHEVGTVKYIGPVDFEEGLWLGLELRTSKGRHDGVVGGKRYFTCRAGHGVMVRPSKVTVRGINGAQLIKSKMAEERHYVTHL